MTNFETGGSGTASSDRSAEATLYAALMAHTIHQDQLLWSRTQTLIAIQGAVLVAGYALQKYWVGWAILLLGALLTMSVFVLIVLDGADRDANRGLMDGLARDLVPDPIVQQMGSAEAKGLVVRFSADSPRWRRTLSGPRIMLGIVLGFVALDLVLVLLFAGGMAILSSP